MTITTTRRKRGSGRRRRSRRSGATWQQRQGKTTGLRIIFFCSFCCFVITCYVRWPNWFFSTGLGFVLPLRFFVCSRFLLFSWQIPTKPHLLALKKNPSTLSLSLTYSLVNVHCFQTFCFVFCCSVFWDLRFDSMPLFLDRGCVWISPFLFLDVMGSLWLCKGVMLVRTIWVVVSEFSESPHLICSSFACLEFRLVYAWNLFAPCLLKRSCCFSVAFFFFFKSPKSMNP